MVCAEAKQIAKESSMQVMF